MKLAPEGVPFIVGFALLAAVAWLAASYLNPQRLWQAVAVGFALLGLFSVWFFRNPTPDVPADADLVVAPGQGRIIVVDEVEEPTFLEGPARRVSIFLSVFDVHVQRAPVSGTVRYRTYDPGAYAVAWADKASSDNERASLGIATPAGGVLVRQIAGLVARRIVTDPEPGDAVERGARIGLIRFGSRVDVFMPPDWEVLVSVGDRVTVGETPLARMPGAGG